MIQQYSFTLKPKKRGYHLVTVEVMSHVKELPQTGLLHVFVQHTSCGITINENADPAVRIDFEMLTDELIPEGHPEYTHLYEGPDDMPAHIKASLYGSSVTIPITDGILNLGNWQDIYFCEFRDNGGPRNLVATVYS